MNNLEIVYRCKVTKHSPNTEFFNDFYDKKGPNTAIGPPISNNLQINPHQPIHPANAGSVRL